MKTSLLWSPAWLACVGPFTWLRIFLPINMEQVEAKRLLVNSLTRSAPSVLGFLEMVLESGFSTISQNAAGTQATREAEAAMHDALGVFAMT